MRRWVTLKVCVLLFLPIFFKKTGKRAGKRKQSLDDERSRDADFSDQDISDIERCASAVDSDAEDSFMDDDDDDDLDW